MPADWFSRPVTIGLYSDGSLTYGVGKVLFANGAFAVGGVNTPDEAKAVIEGLCTKLGTRYVLPECVDTAGPTNDANFDFGALSQRIEEFYQRTFGSSTS